MPSPLFLYRRIFMSISIIFYFQGIRRWLTFTVEVFIILTSRDIILLANSQDRAFFIYSVLEVNSCIWHAPKSFLRQVIFDYFTWWIYLIIHVCWFSHCLQAPVKMTFRRRDISLAASMSDIVTTLMISRQNINYRRRHAQNDRNIKSLMLASSFLTGSFSK